MVGEVPISSKNSPIQRGHDYPGVSKLTMRGTQTPLTLIGATMQKYNEEEPKSESKNTNSSSDNPKTEISLALNGSPDPPPHSSTTSGLGASNQFSQFRVEAVRKS